MPITVRIKELPDGFVDSFTGIIERTETIFPEYVDFRGNNHQCDYDFGAQKQYSDMCDSLSTAMSMWANRPRDILKVLSIADIKIHPVGRKSVTLKSRFFENPDYYKEKGFFVGLEKEVENSVESSWSNVQSYFIGEMIDYEIEPLDGPSFYYSQRWGETTERSESTVLEDPAATYPLVLIKPRKSIHVKLNAIVTTIRVRIQYRCDYDGVTSYSYETIKAKFYTDPTISF